MGNPFFQAMNNNPGMPFNPAQMKQQFMQWRQGVNGDPQAIINQMMQSGRVSQAQLDKAQQMARMFGQFLK